MARKLTQKQVAEKYHGNLDYFKKAHYLRRYRLWCFVAVVVLSVGAIATFRFWGSEELLSTGPLSASHAAIAKDCRACHLDIDRSFLETVYLKAPSGPPVPDKVTSSGLAHMDQACLQCHRGLDLHQPQIGALTLQTAVSQLPVVHATACATCHREHVGRERMALPSSQTCVSCHSDPEQLRNTREVLKLTNPPVAAAGENRKFSDGVVRFIAPEKGNEELPAFASYAAGHPVFGYEQPYLRDPSTLKYNHARHARSDIPALAKGKLDCADCHQPGADGIFVQPVKYEQHCQQCHSLQIQPSLPKLVIPHGDPQKVRFFLASLESSFRETLRADGIISPVELDRATAREMDRLRQRGLLTQTDLEERVFFQGEPGGDQVERIASRGGKFLTECAKCHTVTRGEANAIPKIAPVNIAERWVQRGPFTHLPHQHMACTDCHGAAQKSKLTSDILMPPQALCAECHRAPQSAQPGGALGGAQHIAGLRDRAEIQRREGGVKWDCQSCHGFHAPMAASELIPRAAASR